MIRARCRTGAACSRPLRFGRRARGGEMADQATGQPRGASLALAEPTVAVRRSLVILAKQATVAGVAAGWVCFSAFQNGEYASLSAAIPDHGPVRQRAAVAGWVGMPQALGLVVGTLLVVDVFTGLLAGYLALAIALVLLALPFVLFTPDHPLDFRDRAPLSVRQLASSYWLSPRKYPDFGWAWITRFLTSLAIAIGTLYLLYFLRDVVHYARLFPGQTALFDLLILTVIYTGGVVITAIVGGMISDRLGRPQ